MLMSSCLILYDSDVCGEFVLISSLKTEWQPATTELAWNALIEWRIIILPVSRVRCGSLRRYLDGILLDSGTLSGISTTMR